jgi:hypothetical protein
MNALRFLGIAALATVAWAAMQFAIWLAHKLHDEEEE